MSQDNTSRNSTRRGFLVTAGAAGVAAGLAGCIGGDGGTDGGDGNDSNGTDGDGNATDPDDTANGEPVDPAFTRAVWSVPKNLQYNPYNQTAPYSGRAAEHLHPSLNKPNIQTGEVYPWVASDWGKDDGKYVIHLADMVVNDEMPFHDGNGAFGARDVATKFKLDTYLGYALSNFTEPERIRALPDEGRVEIGLTKDYNEAILNERFSNYRFDTPHHVYEEYLKNFQDAENESAIQSAQEELTTLTLEKPVGAGPQAFVSADSKELVLEKFDQHPSADKLNFPKVNFIHADTNQQAWQALRGGETDGYNTIFTPSEVVKSYPDYIMEIFIPANWGMGIGFNANNKHYSQRNVRKAIAYYFNRKEIAKNSGGDSKAPVEFITGIPGAMQGAPERILGEKYIEMMENYYVESKPEQAAAHMRAAGYSKENGKWVGPDGEVPEFPMKVPAGFSDWVAGTQTAVSQMKQFGLNAEMVTVEGSSFWSQWTNGNFQVMAIDWTVGNTVPYLNFNYQLRSNGVVENANWDPKSAKVPPMGEPDGELQPAKINPKLDRLAKTNPDSTDYQKYAAQGAWLENQLMWRMPIQEKLDQSWYTTDDWEVPPSDSKKHQVHWPQSWHMRTGTLDAKTK